MKALEKDLGRRNGSASGLARDIERLLDNQPVLASSAVVALDVDDDIASRAVKDRCLGDALRAFLSRLAALIPAPRVNLVTYHGLLAPAASYRDRVVPKAEE